jgi:hypothetical protein
VWLFMPWSLVPFCVLHVSGTELCVLMGIPNKSRMDPCTQLEVCTGNDLPCFAPGTLCGWWHFSPAVDVLRRRKATTLNRTIGLLILSHTDLILRSLCTVLARSPHTTGSQRSAKSPSQSSLCLSVLVRWVLVNLVCLQRCGVMLVWMLCRWQWQRVDGQFDSVGRPRMQTKAVVAPVRALVDGPCKTNTDAWNVPKASHRFLLSSTPPCSTQQTMCNQYQEADSDTGSIMRWR